MVNWHNVTSKFLEYDFLTKATAGLDCNIIYKDFRNDKKGGDFDGKPTILIGDESGEASEFTNTKVFRNFWVPTLSKDEIPLPLGLTNGFVSDIKPILERRYLFSFIGQAFVKHRKECLKRAYSFRDKFPHFKVFIQETSGFGKGLDKKEYSELIADSVFVLCPNGAPHPDTYRYTEAMSCGSIPVRTKKPKSFTLWYDSPDCVWLDDWFQLEALAHLKWQNFEAYKAKIVDFYNKNLTAEAVGQYIKSKI